MTVIVVLAETPAQVTVIGQLPRVVLTPTFHVQPTVPAPSLVAGLSPAAVDGPDLYWTTIEQDVFAVVLT